MTKEERNIMEQQFGNLAELFETKLQASEKVICERVSGLEKTMTFTKAKVDTHVEWHNSLNRRITGGLIKYMCLTLAITVLVVFVLGMKDGIIPAVIAKVIG